MAALVTMCGAVAGVEKVEVCEGIIEAVVVTACDVVGMETVGMEVMGIAALFVPALIAEICC